MDTAPSVHERGRHISEKHMEKCVHADGHDKQKAETGKKTNSRMKRFGYLGALLKRQGTWLSRMNQSHDVSFP